MIRRLAGWVHHDGFRPLGSVLSVAALSVAALSVAGAFSLSACGGSNSDGLTNGAPGPVGCQPGTVVSCACTGGVTGTQSCVGDGSSFTACACPTGTDPVSSSSGGSTGVAGGGAPGAGGTSSQVGAGGTSGAGGTTTTGTGGTTTAGSGGTTNTSSGTAPTALPTAQNACATIAQGATLQFLHLKVRFPVVGAGGGPVLVYWYGTGGFDTAQYAYGAAVTSEIGSLGGMVVEPISNSPSGNGTGVGTSTGNGVWFTGDYAVIDEVIACAMQQRGIDTSRIYVTGFSAGGLQTAAMSYARSNYLAAAVPFSGGIISGLTNTVSQNPGNKFPAMIVYGGASDVVGMSFETASNAYKSDLSAKGQFSFLCNHNGGHSIPSGIGTSAWQFMKDHPFGTSPSPYAGGLPSTFPTYCTL